MFHSTLVHHHNRTDSIYRAKIVGKEDDSMACNEFQQFTHTTPTAVATRRTLTRERNALGLKFLKDYECPRW
jgi:hypothetical protein